LAFPPDQHPIVLQIGGSNLENLAKATEHADAYGYDEINFKLVCFFLNILSIKMSLLF
jgi:tRNA-dihydrouridine synthase A